MMTLLEGAHLLCSVLLDQQRSQLMQTVSMIGLLA
jgi:hypothetical protein